MSLKSIIDFAQDATNNLIDFSRIGALARSGTHHYSTEELMARGFIIFCMAMGGYLGYKIDLKNVPKTRTLLIGATLGLLASHALTLWPLIQKRRACQQQCLQIKNEILSQYKNDQDALNKIINHIRSLTKATESKANASQTWGYRLRMMQNLQHQLSEQINITEFIKNKPEEILKILEESPRITNSNQGFKSAK